MKKFLPDLIAILAFIILSFAYFFPADIEGRILFQHDTAAGVCKEIKRFIICSVFLLWQYKKVQSFSRLQQSFGILFLIIL